LAAAAVKIKLEGSRYFDEYSLKIKKDAGD